MGASPIFRENCTQTFQVISTGSIGAGLLAEYVLEGNATKIQPAQADSAAVAGVAQDDAVGTSNPGNPITYASGIQRQAIDSSTMVDSIAVSKSGIWGLKASAAVAAFDRVKAGAGGTIVTWVSGTDGAELIVGIAQAAIASGATGPVELRLGV